MRRKSECRAGGRLLQIGLHVFLGLGGGGTPALRIWRERMPAPSSEEPLVVLHFVFLGVVFLRVVLHVVFFHVVHVVFLHVVFLHLILLAFLIFLHLVVLHGVLLGVIFFLVVWLHRVLGECSEGSGHDTRQHQTVENP